MIGTRCKRGNAFSRGVLIRRKGLSTRSFVNRKKAFALSCYPSFLVLNTGGLTPGKHPDTFRTRKLSPVVAMILRLCLGKVASRQYSELELKPLLLAGVFRWYNIGYVERLGKANEDSLWNSVLGFCCFSSYFDGRAVP